MKKKLWLFIFLAIFMTVAFGGCSTNDNESMAQALLSEIKRQNVKRETFYFKPVPEVEKQIENAGRIKKGKPIVYTIKGQVPDITALNEDFIVVQPPEYDIKSTDSEEYGDEYWNRAYDAVLKYLDDDRDVKATKVMVEVEFTKSGDDWEVEIDEKTVKKIGEKLADEISQFSESKLQNNKEYKLLKCAQNAGEIAAEAFGSNGYAENAYEITDVYEEEGGGFAVEVSYADPLVVYPKAYAACYDFYAKSKGTLYGDVSQRTVSEELAEFVSEFSAETIKESKLFIEYDEAGNPDITELENRISGELLSQAQTLMKKVNNEFVIRTVEKPQTGVLWGDNLGEKVNIKTDSGDVSYLLDMHVLFYRLASSDINEEGTKTLSCYIRAGDVIEVHLPAGSYKILRGAGAQWYGEEVSFGADASYVSFGKVFKVEKGYEYSLTLSSQEESNSEMSGESIPYPFG